MKKFTIIFAIVLFMGLFGLQEEAAASSQKIIMIDSGCRHNIALKNDGTVWAWGSNKYQQMGIGSDKKQYSYPVQVIGLSDIVAIDAGYYHNVA